MALTRLKSPEAAARWLREWVTGTLRTDSRKLKAGDAFIAWPGYANDGRQFAQAALAAGASTCVVEANKVEHFGFTDARIAALPELKASTGLIAHEFFKHPSHQLDVVASTGTNGKTSTAWWTSQALTLLGQPCGVVGTLGIGQIKADSSEVEFTGLTTPDPVTLQAAFRQFVDQGFKACAIEASSHGVAEQRLTATRIRVALFTNFTQDHLDYHGSMQAYWAAKSQVFSWPGLQAAVLNIDDAKGAELSAQIANRLDVWTYSTQAPARLRALDLHYEDGGLAFTLLEGEQSLPVKTRLVGEFNVSNLLAVIGALRALGHGLTQIVAICPQIRAVPGRMQRVDTDAAGPQVVVDYSHTPDALEKALLALVPAARERGGKLWCVFGCGGDRDAGKRPVMGAIATRLADHAIITSDNPRFEDPQAIIAQIAVGAGATAQQIEDRHAAIAQAVSQAQPQDVILIAGKGHEDYQDIQGVKKHFSDPEEALAALHQRGQA